MFFWYFLTPGGVPESFTGIKLNKVTYKSDKCEEKQWRLPTHPHQKITSTSGCLSETPWNTFRQRESTEEEC